MKTRSAGFTLYEFAVCMGLTAFLGGTLLTRLGEYHRQSERVAVEGVVASVRTALAVREAHAMASGGGRALAALARENPVTWLAPAPPRYQGERAGGAAMQDEAGWYFDTQDQSLNFLQSNDTFSLETPKLLKFKVKLLRRPVSAEHHRPGEASYGLVFDRVDDRAASDHH